jgi:putative DNA primase/helicase
LKGNFVPLCTFFQDEPIPKPLIGEGAETTLSPMQLTGLPGVAAGGESNFESVNPPEADEYIILVDNDINMSRIVMLARRLSATGAKVRLAKPIKPEGGKKGYDWNDALIDAGDDEDQLLELRRAILKAPRFDPTASAEERRILDPKAPLASARVFVASCAEVKLVYHRGDFFEWHGTHYEICEGEHLRSKLYLFLEASFAEQGKKIVPFNPTAHKVNQIIDALKAGIGQDSRQEAPFWLDDDEHPDVANLIDCRNGLLDLTSYELLPHTPLFFNLNCLPYNYDAEASRFPPKWRKFLHQLWPGDEGKQERMCLQEIFGLALTPMTNQQKMFLLLGPKRSGKGTIARVLTALLGPDNVVNPNLANLGGEFGLQPLIGKRMAIISDARLGASSGINTMVERLLNISGEDDITINRKFKTHWTGRLTARILLLSNELPRVPDTSGAFASRFILLKLENTFIGQEDVELTEKLLTELPGILNWSLRGLERLLHRGYFELPERSQQAIRQFEDLTSPVNAFVRDCCRVGVSRQVNVKGLYKAWTLWCEQQGQRPGSSIVFGRDLRAVLPKLQTRGRGAERVYIGLTLSSQALAEQEE